MYNRNSLTSVLTAVPLALCSTMAWAQDSVEVPAPPTTFALVPLAPPPSRPLREPSGLADIVRARFPLAVQYKEFGLGWRELQYGGVRYFTKGDTAWLKGEEYLVAYRFEPRKGSELDKMEYITSTTNNGTGFVAEDRFKLTLLPTGNLVSLMTEGNSEIRSFDPLGNRPVALNPGQFSNAFNQNLSLIYLRKIFAAVDSYSRAYLDVLPPLETAFAAQQALRPYAENPTIFTQPGTIQPFKTNPLFSNRKRTHVQGRRGAVLFYEAQSGPDGLRAVLLLNGTVRRVDERAWERLKKLSDLE